MNIQESLDRLTSSQLKSVIRMLLLAENSQEDLYVAVVVSLAQTPLKFDLIKATRYIAQNNRLREVKDFVEGSGALLATGREARALKSLFRLLQGEVLIIPINPTDPPL